MDWKTESKALLFGGLALVVIGATDIFNNSIWFSILGILLMLLSIILNLYSRNPDNKKPKNDNRTSKRL